MYFASSGWDGRRDLAFLLFGFTVGVLRRSCLWLLLLVGSVGIVRRRFVAFLLYCVGDEPETFCLLF